MINKFGEPRYTIFGITRWGLIIAYDLISKVKKIVFCDNDVNKQKKDYIAECDCVSPQQIDKKIPCIVAVKTEANKECIRKQLTEIGVENIMLLDQEFMNSYEKEVEDEPYLKAIWFIQMGYELDLEHPKTFNEKLQWLKIHNRKPEYTMMVDKYEVKEYVANKIGKEHVIPTYGIWDSFDEIDFDSLPEQFVLKCTHDSGSIAICKNKADFDFESARIKLENGLKENYYYSLREWPYKDVKPRIIAEKFIDDKKDGSLTDRKLMGVLDYKVHCFGGRPQFIQVIGDRNAKDHSAKQLFYDFEWNELKYTFEDYPRFENSIDRPVHLDLMKYYAGELSAKIPYVRVDFYEVEGLVYFGEITIYPFGGLYKYKDSFTREVDALLGEMIDFQDIS